MNKKIITHEQASKRIKELEIKQRFLKARRDHSFKFEKPENAAVHQLHIFQNKKEINTLLSVIYWHKKAKKIFANSKKKTP